MFNCHTFSARAERGRFLACALLAGIVCGCGQPASEAPSKEPPAAQTVEVTPAQPHPCPRTIRVQGSLMGDEQAVVGTKVEGRVDRVDVDLGSRVLRGDTLAVLDLKEFEVRVKLARADVASVRARLGLRDGQGVDRLDPNQTPAVLQEKAVLSEAKANYERAVTLVRGGGVTAGDLQLRKTALDVAEARHAAALHQVNEQLALLEKYANALILAEQALTDATITAPFNGIVAARHVAPGVPLQIGDPVVTLVRIDPLRFSAGVPERHASLLRTGQRASITVEGETSPLTGTVQRISPLLDLASRSLAIEIDVGNPGLRLRAGLFAEAVIVVDPDARALAVPQSAVVEFAGVEKVCVVEDGQAVMRRVITGRKLGDKVEIVEGLRPGEQVAVDGQTARPGPVAEVRMTNDE